MNANTIFDIFLLFGAKFNIDIGISIGDGVGTLFLFFFFIENVPPLTSLRNCNFLLFFFRQFRGAFGLTSQENSWSNGQYLKLKSYALIKSTLPINHSREDQCLKFPMLQHQRLLFFLITSFTINLIFCSIH